MPDMWIYYVEEVHEGKIISLLHWTVNLIFCHAINVAKKHVKSNGKEPFTGVL